MTAYDNLALVRSNKPLVHHLTNWVTIYDCANIVKMFGASPVMAHDREEVEQMVGMASALVLNIGTLTSELIQAMKLAAGAANRRKIPVILDVCGAGATKFRDDSCFDLLDNTRINVIKGNASEICRIAGTAAKTKGVDSGDVDQDLEMVAVKLAQQRNCCVVITGKIDVVSDSKITYRIANGHELMSHVVGTGCMAASVIGTFCAVNPDVAEASVNALCCYEIAAELAVKKSDGPGSFKESLFDRAYKLDAKAIKRSQKVSRRRLLCGR